MSPAQQNISSGSEGGPQYATVDERKRRRMVSNRESAKRSRMRKQKRLDDLINQVSQLQKENGDIIRRVNDTAQIYLQIASENNVLEARMLELTERLQSMNSVLQIAEEVIGFAMDIPEIPDPLLKPWKLPCPSQPITASADMLQF